MLNRKNKQFVHDILFRPTTLSIVGFSILIAICFPLIKNINKQYSINKEIEGLHNEIKNFESKNLELKDTFKYLESDQFASEQARINLNYKIEGEEVVVIKSQENEIPASKLDNTYSVQGINDIKTEEVKTSNAVLWWRYFFY